MNEPIPSADATEITAGTSGPPREPWSAPRLARLGAADTAAGPCLCTDGICTSGVMLCAS
jgi:hypothetical protein